MRRLAGVVQPYAWGSTDFIPELLGEEPTGEPQAELWLGAHSSAPSTVDGTRLDELIREDPEGTVGSVSVSRFGPLLPYLMKVLSAAEPLSLQAHPSRAQAEAGFAAEEEAGVALDAPERTFRDDWPKPEMLCCLVETEILCGFRAPDETYALFERLGVGSALTLVEPLRGGGAEELEQVFRAILRLGDRATELVAAVEAGAAALVAAGEGDDHVYPFVQTARDLGRRYPDDPGVLAALLMNRVTLRPYEGTFLAAGNLHAYLKGSGIEIMANSDNVLRGGLTSKHIDVDQLLEVLDFTPGFPGLVEVVEEPPGVFCYRTPAPEFALWRLEPRSAALSVPKHAAGRVVLVTGGAAELTVGTEQLALARGQSAFLPAGEDVQLTGHATVFVAAPGV
jgi:mannose-6-phosphate isomerase